MNIDELTIGEAKELACLFSGKHESPCCAENHGLQIVVCDRGFVYVGETTTDDKWCIIKNARNIRVWGTSKGLGELAQGGPLSGTKLDDVGTVKAPMKAVIHLIACESRKWK
jgi:hypothetical protein